MDFLSWVETTVLRDMAKFYPTVYCLLLCPLEGNLRSIIIEGLGLVLSAVEPCLTTFIGGTIEFVLYLAYT